jgi:hypothetical protein
MRAMIVVPREQFDQMHEQRVEQMRKRGWSPREALEWADQLYKTHRYDKPAPTSPTGRIVRDTGPAFQNLPVPTP